jgi:hypothetical protein
MTGSFVNFLVVSWLQHWQFANALFSFTPHARNLKSRSSHSFPRSAQTHRARGTGKREIEDEDENEDELAWAKNKR